MQAFEHARLAGAVVIFRPYREDARHVVVFEMMDVFVADIVGKFRHDRIPHLPLPRDCEQYGRGVAHGDALRIIDEIARPADGGLHHRIAAEGTDIADADGCGKDGQSDAEIGRLDISDGGIAEGIFTIKHSGDPLCKTGRHCPAMPPSVLLANYLRFQTTSDHIRSFLN